MTVPSADTTFTVQNPDGTQHGPASIEQLKAWAQEGLLSSTSRLIPETGGQSIVAAGFLPLQGYLDSQSDVMATLIPWRNSCALIGYYLGMFGLIPILGSILSPVAIVLGILGIVHWKKNHQSHGLVHAIVAILCGVIGVVISSFIIMGLALANSTLTM